MYLRSSRVIWAKIRYSKKTNILSKNDEQYGFEGKHEKERHDYHYGISSGVFNGGIVAFEVLKYISMSHKIHFWYQYQYGSCNICWNTSKKWKTFIFSIFSILQKLNKMVFNKCYMGNLFAIYWRICDNNLLRMYWKSQTHLRSSFKQAKSIRCRFIVFQRFKKIIILEYFCVVILEKNEKIQTVLSYIALSGDAIKFLEVGFHSSDFSRILF